MNIDNVLFIKAYNDEADRVVYIPLSGITSIEAVTEDTSLIYASGKGYIANHNADDIITAFNQAYFMTINKHRKSNALRRRIRRLAKKYDCITAMKVRKDR